jgi:nitronate monooxygenase
MNAKAGIPMPLILGDREAKIPLVQGGMGVGISLSGLSSAVAEEGGIGVIATAGIGSLEPDFYKHYLLANRRSLENQIRKARARTKGILGVNIMVALTNYADFVETSVREKIDVIFSGAGLPLHLPEFIDRSGVHPALVPIVSSGKAASIIARQWQRKYDYLPDAVVVEGPQAGGHLGFKIEQIDDPAFALERLVPEVVQALEGLKTRDGRPIPVIAAGGIYTGKDIYQMINRHGASAVQMATRFVATYECDASNEFKAAYLRATESDLRIIVSPVGMPGRAIDGDFLQRVARGEKQPYTCPYHCLFPCDYTNSPYCIALALVNAQKGMLSNGFAFAGTNAARVDRIVSVHELVQSLLAEYAEAAAGH